MNGQREKRCAVIGLARAGIPAAQFLAERGVQVLGYDSKTLSEILPQARALQNLGVELHLGDHGFKDLKSCGLIVLSPGLKIHHEPLLSVLEAAQASGSEVIGELELAARHCPAPMIAVTGTKGKSTTVKLLEEMLRAVGISAFRAGNTGTPLIAELPKLSPASWAVVEVSSFQLERAPTFKPRIAVMLNLLPDHQDYHTSLQQYWDTKMKIFARQNSGDTAVFNVDDANVRAHLPQVLEGGAQVLGASGIGLPQVGAQVLGGAGVQDGVLGWSSGGQFEEVIALDRVPLRGAHNVANVAAALAALRAVVGNRVLESTKSVANVIEIFQSLPHRLELVTTRNGVQWINDSQATIPDAAIAALRSFAAPVILIAGGRNKLDDARAFDNLGVALAQRAHGLVLIGEASAEIARAARAGGMDAAKIIEAGQMQRAVRDAAKMAGDFGAGATVVMSPACASFDQFSSFEDRGQQFRDAVAALDAG